MPLGFRDWCRDFIAASLIALAAMLLAAAFTDTADAAPLVSEFLDKAKPSDLVPGADAYGPLSDKAPAVAAMKDGKRIGWVFLTSDFVPTAGYSGKPIHILAGISDDAVITGVRLMQHHEPIVLVGIPEARIKAVTEKYAGLDLKKEAVSQGSAHDPDIVSGATVTIMIIDDSIVRAGIKVAKSLSLGGLSPDSQLASAKRQMDRTNDQVKDWQTLAGDGSIRHFTSMSTRSTAISKVSAIRARKSMSNPAPAMTPISISGSRSSASPRSVRACSATTASATCRPR